jgi:CubicO group peptidase (beta-lactamase class C family)
METAAAKGRRRRNGSSGFAKGSGVIAALDPSSCGRHDVQGILEGLSVGEMAKMKQNPLEPSLPGQGGMSRSLWAVATAVLAAAISAAGVVQVRTAQEILEIEPLDARVEVIVDQGGQRVRVIDRQTDGQVEWQAGKVRLDAAGGLDLDLREATLKRGGRIIARIRKQTEELAALDEVMCRYMRERTIGAGALAVMKDGQLLLNRGYGFADSARKVPLAATARFRLASLTKPFTAAAVQRLIRAGKLRADSHAFALLAVQAPEGSKPDPRLQDITIQHLLTHQGGWDRAVAFDPMFRSLEIAAALGKAGPASSEDIIRYMAGQPLQFAPGSRTVYSNFGYCVLGRIIEKVIGRSYIDYVRDEVLAPLGITGIVQGRTLPKVRQPDEPVYVDPGRGRNVMQPESREPAPAPDGTFCLEAMDAHGGLVASPADVARFFQAYQFDGWPARTPAAGAIFGSLPGSFTLALRRPDGVVMVALFNQRTDVSGRDYDLIRDLLNQAADRVARWPVSEKPLRTP